MVAVPGGAFVEGSLRQAQHTLSSVVHTTCRVGLPAAAGATAVGRRPMQAMHLGARARAGSNFSPGYRVGNSTLYVRTHEHHLNTRELGFELQRDVLERDTRSESALEAHALPGARLENAARSRGYPRGGTCGSRPPARAAAGAPLG